MYKLMFSVEELLIFAFFFVQDNNIYLKSFLLYLQLYHYLVAMSEKSPSLSEFESSLSYHFSIVSLGYSKCGCSWKNFDVCDDRANRF